MTLRFSLVSGSFSGLSGLVLGVSGFGYQRTSSPIIGIPYPKGQDLKVL